MLAVTAKGLFPLNALAYEDENYMPPSPSFRKEQTSPPEKRRQSPSGFQPRNGMVRREGLSERRERRQGSPRSTRPLARASSPYSPGYNSWRRRDVPGSNKGMGSPRSRHIVGMPTKGGDVVSRTERWGVDEHEAPEVVEARLIDRQKELIREIEADIYSLKMNRAASLQQALRASVVNVSDTPERPHLQGQQGRQSQQSLPPPPQGAAAIPTQATSGSPTYPRAISPNLRQAPTRSGMAGSSSSAGTLPLSAPRPVLVETVNVHGVSVPFTVGQAALGYPNTLGYPTSPTQNMVAGPSAMGMVGNMVPQGYR
eukprot:gnl/TRDRNA2_/TRDRNA2_42121_c0_seq1.p1 gnl/TRDRNA2_/TRDRNA2_42121_c0~~gnl/TRDRNA2_/TRDRNA2_42121_c0_seq1.p1  ORF type:complete len:344 (+),score=39.51 gnl/TRDRNA2_/TRDRNA2_42121_c0_seq1:96-1034(+)